MKLPGDACADDWLFDRAAETASRDDVRAHARKAFDAQLRHLLEDSPFYKDKLRGFEHARFDDLRRLPFTTKQELKAAAEMAPPWGTHAAVPATAIKRVYQTSGTSGTPSVIALTKKDVETWTTIGARTYYATGIHAHHAVLSTFGAGPFVAGHTNFVLTAIGCRAVPVGAGDTERTLFTIKAGLADTLLATPSFAQYLANRHPGLNVDHVVTGGEPGGGIRAVRDHIERGLGAFVNEIMGIGDVAPSLFGECPARQGMHFSGAGHVWAELVDPDTREALEIEPGAVGELAYTHLTREAHAVLRFLGGDVVRVEGVDCDCGRTGFRMRVVGRRDDMFIVRGVNVYPSAILAVIGEFRPRVTGRARVVRPNNAVAIEPPVPIEVETPGAPDPGLEAELEMAIRSRLTFRAAVTLVPEASFGVAGYKTPLTVTRG
jgi:phenylacetate-CoA ligase